MSSASAVRPRHYEFEVGLRWSGEKKGVASATGKPDLAVATPPEFRGHAGVWSPEDLFVEAANVCLMSTFLALAEREALEVIAYESQGRGVVAFAAGSLRFTSIVLSPHIRVAAADIERARRVVAKAEQACLVSASMSTPIRLETTIEAAANGSVRSVL